MAIHLIEVPYDSGHRDRRMGGGPGRLMERGAVRRLEEAGHDVRHDRVEASAAFPAEIATAFELNRLIATTVSRASASGGLPLLLAGNCNSALGAVAGLGGPNDVGVVWFDAHADCETPETTESGFLDGMGFAALTGHCWARAAGSIPGFRPVPAERTVLIGARQVSEAEHGLIGRSNMTYVPVERIRQAGVDAAIAPHLDRLRSKGVRRLYLHVDLDVHDPSIAPANTYAEPGGLTADEVRSAVALIGKALPVGAATLSAYDPACDVEDRMLAAGLALIAHIAAIADRPA